MIDKQELMQDMQNIINMDKELYKLKEYFGEKYIDKTKEVAGVLSDDITALQLFLELMTILHI